MLGCRMIVVITDNKAISGQRSAVRFIGLVGTGFIESGRKTPSFRAGI
jgi:hypothetical protein